MSNGQNGQRTYFLSVIMMTKKTFNNGGNKGHWLKNVTYKHGKVDREVRGWGGWMGGWVCDLNERLADNIIVVIPD